MARTASNMLPLGTKIPSFELPDFSGEKYSSDDLMGKKGILVAFICNHCPFVKHIESALASVFNVAQRKGFGVVAINANDIENYPDDSPEKMAVFAEKNGFEFPYLFDESQNTAKAFDAACTPDFYLFDRDGKLFYRGQFDSSRPGNDIPVTGTDLVCALESMLAGKTIPEASQKPSLGCNIKWK